MMNTKALRQKILDLAIHGKLVPQDPNDEPASVLLERIKAEKERLIKEGKIKRTKRSKAACDKPHYPYELPKGWCWTTLGEVISIKSGNAIKVRNNKNGSFPIYGGNGISAYSDEYNIDKPTIVIGRVGFYCGSIHYVKSKAWVTDNAFITSMYENAYDIDFLYYLLIYCNLRQYSNSTAQPVISGKTIYPVHVPVPPIKEQRKIVEKIEFWLSCISQLEFSQSKVKSTIKQAKSKILDLAIHGKLVPQDPNDEPASELLKRINPKAEITCDNPQYGKLPNGWCRCTLKDIGIFESGYAFSSDEYKQNGVPLVRISNITNNGNIDLSSCVYIQNYNNSKFIIHEGDLLIAMSGATTGKMGVYKYKTDALLNQRVGNLKCTEAWLQQYRNYFMLAKSNYILNIAYGGAQPNISAKAILSIKIDLPPINEQHRIVAKIEELFTQLDNITSSI